MCSVHVDVAVLEAAQSPQVLVVLLDVLDVDEAVALLVPLVTRRLARTEARSNVRAEDSPNTFREDSLTALPADDPRALAPAAVVRGREVAVPEARLPALSFVVNIIIYLIIAAPHPAVDVVHDEVVRHVSVGEHGLHPRVAHHPAGNLRVTHPPGVVTHGLALRDFKY